MNSCQKFFTHIPLALNKEELTNYFMKYYEGDLEARNQIIIHNIRLVFWVINKYFQEIEQEEIFSIGLIALIESVDTFDLKAQTTFATYACKCISYAIFNYLRHANYLSVESLDTVIYENNKGNKLLVKDILPNQESTADTYENRELSNIIGSLVEELNPFDKTLVKSYFGWENNEAVSQKNLAQQFGLSAPQISRRITKSLRYLAQRLKELNLVDTDYHFFIEKDAQKVSKRYQVKDIYTFFPNHRKEEIDDMLEQLTLEEKILYEKRHSLKGLTIQESNHYYNCLVPRMRKILENPNYHAHKKR